MTLGEEAYMVAEEWHKGGSYFYGKLADAIRWADNTNTQKIKDAFQEEWDIALKRHAPR